MAANDYFHDNRPPPAHSPSPAPYHGSQYTPSPQSTPAPAYSAVYSAPDPSTPRPQGAPPNPSGPSPFDTVFDDHVYPMNSRTYAGASSGDMSQQHGQYQGQQHGQYQDTSYYGRGSPESRPPIREDIPLQDRPGKDGDTEMNDHIYDAPRRSRRNKKRKVGLGELGMFGSDKKRIPWVVYLFSLIQAGVFIGEIVRNAQLTGSPIMIKPQFNPMIGPSPQVLINMGARYVPCMHNVKDIQGASLTSSGEAPVKFLCPGATSYDETCSLSELCGFGGVPNPEFGNANQKPTPNQWFRFIIPIFMHGGVIHIGFNLLLQMTLAKDMEMAIGSIRFFLIYMSAGIFGFVMGGNFAAPLIASTGASGSLFSMIALTLLDLLYSWNERKSPVKDLLFIILDIVISFVLGLLPGLDNFSHIGGFLTGLCVGISVLHSPNSLRLRMGQEVSYSAMDSGSGPTPFLKSPVGFFKGRKPLWWAWWLIRAAALVLIVVVFIVLLRNFYIVRDECGWCKYLSCLPVKGWCDEGTIKTT